MTGNFALHRAYLLLGSNIDPESNLPAACRMLEQHGTIVCVSRVWESPPADGSAQDNYLNAAILLETPLAAAVLRQQVLPEIENALGRVRDPLNRLAARTIDIDIALFDREIHDLDGAQIPDPDILTRSFVAVPLAEIDPEYVHPESGRTLAEIAATLEGQLPLRLRDDVELNAAS